MGASHTSPCFFPCVQLEKLGAKWTERRFTVFGEHGSHEVRQFHYTEWPDHGVPDEPESVIECVQATMRAQREVCCLRPVQRIVCGVLSVLSAEC